MYILHTREMKSDRQCGQYMEESGQEFYTGSHDINFTLKIKQL